MHAVGAGFASPRIAYTLLLGRADSVPTADVSLLIATEFSDCPILSIFCSSLADSNNIELTL